MYSINCQKLFTKKKAYSVSYNWRLIPPRLVISSATMWFFPLIVGPVKIRTVESAELEPELIK